MMNSILISFAAAGAEVSEQETSGSLTIVVVGFLFVMVVLALLSSVTAVMGAYFARKSASDSAKAAEIAREAAEKAGQAPAAPAAPAAQATPAPAAPEEDPALLAVIAAAVHSVIGDRAHRIVSVRTGGPGWAQEGRRQIFSSHRVR